MEFRDRPSLTKGPISLPDFGWQWPFAPTPDMGMATVPLSALGSSYVSQFLLLTFHFPVLGGMGEECPLGGSTGPHTGAHPKSGFPSPIHSTSKGLPSAHPLRSLPMLCSPLSPLPPLGGPHLPLAKVSWGQGPSWGLRSGVEGRGRSCSVTSLRCPLGRGPEESGGVPGGYFSIFYFQIFLYLNLQICIIQGQPIKEEYNGPPRESGVCFRGYPFLLSHPLKQEVSLCNDL